MLANNPFMLSVAKLSVAPPPRKYQTRLEKHAADEHSSLLCHFVSDEEKEVLL